MRLEILLLEVIMEFRNEYWFCSNFYPATVYGYPTVEHAYQAAKTTDPAERAQIRSRRTAGEAKKLGRQVQLRPDWTEIKELVMETLVRRKFANYPELAKGLLETGETELVETNSWHDNYWGACPCYRCRGRGRGGESQL